MKFIITLIFCLLASSQCHFLGTNLKCASNQFNAGGVCENCDQAYDAFCLKCNDQTCTECQGTANHTQFIASDGSCQDCAGYFGPNCNTCTAQACTDCEGVKNETAFIGYDGKCYTCQYVEEPCVTCNVDQCLTCEAGWVLVGRNCEQEYRKKQEKLLMSDKCQDNQFEQNGQCVNCDDVYGENCSKCSSTECTTCDGQENKTAFIGYNGVCYTCTYVEEQCETCTVDTCLTCIPGWYLDGRNCEPYDEISFQAEKSNCTDGQYEQNGECYNCDQVFDAFCTKCTASACTECQGTKNSTQYIGTDGNCYDCDGWFGPDCTTCNSGQCLTCSGESKQTAFIGYDGKCYQCTTIEEQCSTCNRDQCLTCNQGFTLVGRNCQYNGYQNDETSFQVEKDKCTDGQYEQDGECYNCDQVFDAFCTKCTASACTECQGTKNSTQYIGTDGNCYDCDGWFGPDCTTCNSGQCLTCSGESKQTAFIGYDGKCYQCTTIEEQCSTCNRDQCLTCNQGFTLVGRNCQYDGYQNEETSFQVEKDKCTDGQYEQDGECYNCDQVFDAFCTKCTASACTECQGTKNSTQYIGNDGSCYDCDGWFGPDCTTCNSGQCLTCSGESKQTAFIGYDGKCYQCTMIEEQCNTCNRDQCLTCNQGFTLVGRNCVYQY